MPRQPTWRWLPRLRCSARWGWKWPFAAPITGCNEDANVVSIIISDSRGSGNVGQPIQAADPLSSGSSRLKAGCRQDCLPHDSCQVLRETGHQVAPLGVELVMNPLHCTADERASRPREMTHEDTVVSCIAE